MSEKTQNALSEKQSHLKGWRPEQPVSAESCLCSEVRTSLIYTSRTTGMDFWALLILVLPCVGNILVTYHHVTALLTSFLHKFHSKPEGRHYRAFNDNVELKSTIIAHFLKLRKTGHYHDLPDNISWVISAFISLTLLCASGKNLPFSVSSQWRNAVHSRSGRKAKVRKARNAATAAGDSTETGADASDVGNHGVKLHATSFQDSFTKA